MNCKVWTCKIIVEADTLPNGFDSPPRMAAERAIESHGIKVLMNSSGWGGKLTKGDIDYINLQKQQGFRSDVYFAGRVDELEHKK